MRILFFYQYYHNLDCAATGRHYQFIRRLAREHEVHVVTSDHWEHRRQSHLFEWAPEGVTLHRIHAPYANAMGIHARLGAYATYAAGALAAGLRAPRPDVVVGTSTPLSTAWVAARVARLRRAPWVFEVRDLWPAFPIEMGAIRNTWLQRRLFALEKRLYDSASHIVPLSTDMQAAIEAGGTPASKLTTLVNGTDLDLAAGVTTETIAALRARLGIGDRRVVLYAGTFGRANAIPALIGAAERLRHRDDLCFVFLGDGFYRPALEDAAGRLPNVRVLPPEPRHAIFGWFGLACLSLVTFIDRPVLAANSPAKFFDSLGMGTPVLVTNPGWTKRFVEAHGCGWYAGPAEPDTLAAGIQAALDDPAALAAAGQRGRTAAAAFDRRRLADTFADIVASAGGPR
ncbi:MAG: glycosyltransferase family 4 protein [Rhodothermales bacterium]|nr:glycosyltransferase family 4 protein [Rhodothermales bacterium]